MNFRRYTPIRPTAVSGVPLVQINGVSKHFVSPAGSFNALNKVTLGVSHGEFVAVAGTSGSGKTTLLNMLAGVDRPTSGEVLIDGVAVHALGEDAAARWRGRHVGVVFQFFQLLPTLTAIENVLLPMELCRVVPARERLDRATHLLDQVGLGAQACKLPAQLSGGQQQRVAIARALANRPSLLLADEPTGNLDSQTAQSVFNLFEALAQQGTTVIMVTHDPLLAQRAWRQVQLADGALVEASTPQEVVYA